MLKPIRTGLAIMAVLGLGVATASCASTPESASGLDEVRIVHLPSLLNLPVYVAATEGIFEEEGLDPEFILVSGGSEIGAALVSGSGEFAIKSIDTAVTLSDEGQGIKSVVGVMTQSTQSLVLSTKLEDEFPAGGDVADLKGLRLGVTTPGSGTDIALRAVLTQAGVDPDSDVDIIATRGVTESIPALASGSIDGFLMPEPAPAEAVARDIGYRYYDFRTQAPDALKYLALTGVLAKTDYLEKNPDIVEKLVRSVVRAQDLLDTDPRVAIDAIHEYVSAEMEDEVILSVMETDGQFYNPDITEEQFDALMQALRDGGATDSDYAFDDIVDVQFKDLWSK